MTAGVEVVVDRMEVSEYQDIRRVGGHKVSGMVLRIVL